MRYATFCVIAALVGALPLCADAPAAASPSLTVVLDFKQARSNLVIEEMKRSTGELLAGSGIRLNWTLRADVGSQSFPEVVLVTFHGTCDIGESTPAWMAPGALASSQIVDNEVLPFADVYCDRVASLTRAAMTRADRWHVQQNMGRALAKVLAHELMHMLTKSTEHGVSGVAQPALSGRQLLDQETTLEASDLDRIREEAFSAPSK